MQKFLFLKEDLPKNINENFVYLGHETCQEYFFHYLNQYIKKAKELKEKDFYIVLVIPPLTDLYFKKIIDKIKENSNLFDEITVNDYGTFSLLKEFFKINLGRQLIKQKTGNLDKKILNNLDEENLMEIKKPLINKFLLKKLEKEINFIELNPVIQGIDLKVFEDFSFKIALHFPYVLSSTTFMCWSKVDNVFKRIVNCDISCKFSKTNFLGNSYFIKGNSVYFKEEQNLREYLKKVSNNSLIERVIFHL